MSTIDTSSTIIISASSGATSTFGSMDFIWSVSIFPISNKRCNVFASSPVVSVILLAALPVGAHRTTFNPSCLYNSITVLIMVVLPVPGPPVITQTLCS